MPTMNKHFYRKNECIHTCFLGGREESRPYNTQIISALFNGYITFGFIQSAIRSFY